MSKPVGGPDEKVVSLDLYRRLLTGEHPNASAANDQGTPEGVFLHRAAAVLDEMVGTDRQLGSSRWAHPMTAPDVNVAAIAGDFRTRFATDTGDELASRRAPQATQRYQDGFADFDTFANDTYDLLVQHCAHMCAAEGRDDVLHTAFLEGHLSPANFSSNIKESPFEEALVARLATLEEGLSSDVPEVARDAVALSCDIVTGLARRADDARVYGYAEGTKAAAIGFINDLNGPEDGAKVGMALAKMVASVPPLRDASADLAIELALDHNPFLRSAKALVRPSTPPFQRFRLGR